MKIDMQTLVAEQEGALRSVNAEVEVGPELIQAIAGLYSDIPLAIVREYMTNMYDAYLALSEAERLMRPSPVVHVPTQLEPWIEFTDYGIGLSEDDVFYIFGGVGKSRKRDDNRLVGSFGFGSKTAHAYEGADQWQVESRYNGTKYAFAASKNEIGWPKLMLMTRTPTEELNGMTVRIPVRKQDIQKFYQAVQTIGEYFALPLTITGATMTLMKPTYVRQTEDWGIRQVRNHGYPTQARSRVVMGGVRYDITPEQLNNHPRAAQVLTTFPIDLFVPIGSVNITPSREALQYKSLTLDTINTRAQVVVDTLLRELTERIQAAESEWDALKMYYGGLGLGERLTSLATVPPQWRGKALDTAHGIGTSLEAFQAQYPGGEIEAFIPGERGGWTRRRMQGQMPISLRPDRYHVVLLQDRVRGYVAGAKAALREHGPYANGYRSVEMRVFGYVFQAPGLTQQGLQEFLRGCPVELISKYMPEVEPREKRVKTPLRIVRETGIADMSRVEPTEAVYVRLNNEDLLDYPGPASWNRKAAQYRPVFQWFEMARELGILPTEQRELIGVPRGRASVEKRPGWVELLAAIKPALQKLVVRRAERIADAEEWNAVEDVELAKYVAMLEPKRLAGSPLVAAVQRVQHTQRMAQNREVVLLRRLCAELEIAIPKRDVASNRELVQKVAARYPMMNLLAEADHRWRVSNETFPTIREYIRLIDGLPQD